MITVTWAILFVLMLPAHNQSTGMTNDCSIFNLLRNYSAYGLVFSNWMLTPLKDFVMPISIARLAAGIYTRVLVGALIILEGVALLFPKVSED